MKAFLSILVLLAIHGVYGQSIASRWEKAISETKDGSKIYHLRAKAKMEELNVEEIVQCIQVKDEHIEVNYQDGYIFIYTTRIDLEVEIKDCFNGRLHSLESKLLKPSESMERYRSHL